MILKLFLALLMGSIFLILTLGIMFLFMYHTNIMAIILSCITLLFFGNKIASIIFPNIYKT